VSGDDEEANEYPSLAVADDGSAWLAWDGFVPEAGDEWRIHVSRWTPSDGWSEERIVSSPLDSSVADERPSLSLDSTGFPHVIWHLNDGSLGIGYSEFDGSDWSPPRWAVRDAVSDAVALFRGDRPVVLGVPEIRPSRSPLQTWLPDEVSLPVPEVDPKAQTLATPPWLVANRHVAFGDSITWGQYTDPATGELVGDYPARLELMLNSRVTPSEVINDGVAGERTAEGRWRILLSWDTYHPEFMEIMEGTNDVTGSRPYDGIASNLQKMVSAMKDTGTLPLLATLIPRCDGKYNRTKEMNEYIVAVAALKGVPLVDIWQSFHDYPGGWQALLRPVPDCVHPDTEGMAALAESWYDGILSNVPWLVEDTTPPLTWIQPLPADRECGEAPVEWDGSDDTSWVVDFDVQSNLESGGWTDWLVQTEEHSAYYRDGSDGDMVGFRVRGRDAVGNPSEYGDSSPVYITLHDTLAPEVEMYSLPPAMKAPFSVSWLGEDKCGPVTGFDVEYSVGSPNNWQPWFTDTTSTSGVFDPPSPQYGQTHYFHVLARDGVPNPSGWSDPVSTYVAEYVLSGQVYTVRGLPVMKAEMDTAPIVPVVMDRMGSYEAYLPGGGSYDLTASRDGFGTLPPMHLVSVSDDMDSLDLHLPPLDDAVGDGGFEGGSWGDWNPGGTSTPTFTSQAHTGDGAVVLGGLGDTSTLSQSLSVPGTLTNATLSFLVRLDTAGGSSAILVSVDGTPISHSQVVSTTDWTHAWLPVDAAVGQPVTLTFMVDSNPAVRLDEVSLGTARHGGSVTFLPIVQRDHSP
jgi:lysophospholipase L1-like esterase